jgi:hypothetical protein
MVTFPVVRRRKESNWKIRIINYSSSMQPKWPKECWTKE